MTSHNIYLDTHNRWRDVKTNKLVNNPLNKRCEHENCDNLVRSKRHNFCSNHIDWSKTSHGSSILTNEDVVFITNSVNDGISDKQITISLKNEIHHQEHIERSILLAVRHHKRKYLIHRYDKKFFYKTIKKKYGKDHPTCEMCGWNQTTIDVHHILQIKDFDNELDYHKTANMIALCPNHHRLVEDMRKVDMCNYKIYIESIKKLYE